MKSVWPTRVLSSGSGHCFSCLVAAPPPSSSAAVARPVSPNPLPSSHMLQIAAGVQNELLTFSSICEMHKSDLGQPLLRGGGCKTNVPWGRSSLLPMTRKDCVFLIQIRNWVNNSRVLSVFPPPPLLINYI